MFETVYLICNFIISVVYYIYYVSLKSGQVIVTFSINLVNNVLYFINTILNVLIIILESVRLFLEDIYGSILQVYFSLVYLTEVLKSELLNFIHNIYNGINEIFLSADVIFNIVINTTLSIIFAIGQLFVFLKYLIILFGSGVWFAITFFPRTIAYVTKSIVHMTLKLICDDIPHLVRESVGTLWIGLNQGFQFICDVPLEALVGLLLGLCIGYIFFQFYFVLVPVILYLKEKCVALFNYLCQRVRRRNNNYQRTVQGRRLIREQQNNRAVHSRVVVNKITGNVNKSESQMEDQRCCVICQERPKCILILPCRHVCLCSECNYRLQLYNNTCPICRDDIDQTMKIFV